MNVPQCLPLGLLAAAVLLGVNPAAVAQTGPWRSSYEVYQPTVTNHDVFTGGDHGRLYNHCSTLAWFQDRWFCLWGSNTHPDEHAPGQRIFVSTSRDGRTWSPIEMPFSDPRHSVNPVDYPAGKGHQWQPNFGVVDGELWAVWNQGGGARDFKSASGTTADLRGLYFSRLAQSDGKWINRRIEFDGRALPVIGGEEYNIASTQNLFRLPSGRVLAPVTVWSTKTKAPDAPAKAESWWGMTKINSVIYTDDHGRTWRLSPGTSTPGYSWIQWEPTVWQRPDGTLLMFSRNNIQHDLGHGDPPSGQYLLWSESRDDGQTWSPQQFVPLESVCSRMHVSPLDGQGTWAVAPAGDNRPSRRFVMVHNDAPGGVLGWAAARRNLALFFNRSGDIDFMAGPTLTGLEPEVAYPQMWRHGDTLGICYTQANSCPRSIRVALVHPLPADDRYYLFPRANDAVVPAAPLPVGKHLLFQAAQYLATRGPLDPGPNGVSFGCWIQPKRGGALLDTRSDTAAGRGFVFLLGGTTTGSAKLAPLHPQFGFLGQPNLVADALALPRDGRWHYTGFTLNRSAGEVVFYVDDQSQTVRFTPPPATALQGTTAHLAYKRLAKSRLNGLDGKLRWAAVYSGPQLTAAQHRGLFNRWAEELGHKQLDGAAAVTAQPLLWADPADAAALRRDFVWPDAPGAGGTEVVTIDGRPALRLRDEGSAGIDLDANRRSRGDRVGLEFRFRVEQGPRQVLCTLGDFNQPARLIAAQGQVLLEAAGMQRPCGPITPDGWTTVTLQTWSDRTQAQLAGHSPVEVRHQPIATWAYFGEAFPHYGQRPTNARTLIDVSAVRTRVDKKGAE